MLNLKKGLALVLAAATAFTFAPVANLGNAVEADAANTAFQNAQNIQLTVGQIMTYDVDIPDVVDGTKYSVSNSDPTVVEVGLDYSAGKEAGSVWSPTVTASSAQVANNQSNHSTFQVKALKAGTSTVRVIYHGSNSADITKEISFTVVNKSENPKFTIEKTGGEYATARDAQNSFGFKVADGYTLKVANADNGDAFSIYGGVQTSDSSVVEIPTQPTDNTSGSTGFTINLKKAGVAKLTGKLKNTTQNKDVNFEITINVIANKSTFKIGDSEITGNTAPTYGGSPAKFSNVVKTIYLTADHSSENIGATLTNPQFDGESIKYLAKKMTSNTDVTDLSDESKYGTDEIEVSADGTVKATAKALNASEQYYFVKVKLAKETAKAGWVRVITSRNEKAFTTLKVSVQGKDYEQKASYDVDGNIKDSTDKVVDVKMSTQDRTTVPFTVESTNSYDVKSNDKSTVDVVNGSLVAKRAGVASITISTKSDTTHYGAVTITLKVTVTNQKLDVKVVADPTAITLTKVTKSAKLNASVVATPALTTQPELSYRFVTKNTDGSYSAATSADFDLKGNEITYKTTNEASAIVEISTKSTNDYDTPAPAYVTVKGTQQKAATKLNVTTKALNLDVDGTGAIVASGTALSYASSDTDVATVTQTANGAEVTAVAPGVAVITVTDAGNDEFAGGTATVTVFVKAATVAPQKVTGVKVSNKKGAYVSVKWTSQGGNVNYRIYKKVGNGKWIGKNVAGSKTTLKVKKGAKVQVKVKSYVKDASGKTTWGPTATKAKTFKTDKK